MIGFALAGLVATGVGWTALIWRLVIFARQFAAGAPELARSRRNHPWRRTGAMLREFLLHRKLGRKPLVGLAHWFTMVSFLVLVTTLAQATGQLFNAAFELPVVGHWAPWGWLTELFAWAGLGGIVFLIGVRLRASGRSLGRNSRFFGSHQWRARYVEATVGVVCALVVWLRGLESALVAAADRPQYFPSTAWIGSLYLAGSSASDGSADASLALWIHALALAKILVSYTWMVVVGLTPTMGVAWHRFLAFPNLWTGRNADGSAALGPLPGLVVDGQPVDLEDPDLDESVFERLGAGFVADLTWRDRMALATCTECGRCQEVCPAWATGTALSPKLLVGALRDHAFSSEKEPLPLVGGESAWAVEVEALWACTTCGACTDVCPVGLEQVDQIIELRRHQVLVEGSFSAELNSTFRNLERRQNPWGMLAKKRLDWAKGLDITVPVLGQDVASLGEVEYLYWVGCAGAFDERGQATARAFARLLTKAGVSFAVLGSDECCTGDPARRAGSESIFASLAARNVETLNGAGATKIVVTCAHCLNSLSQEYGPFGGHYQVFHHTELLASLIEQGKLTPEALPDKLNQVTYQDPCYLARHNNQVTAPRRVLGAIPGLELVEMARSGRQGNCCGAGGARMWLEEAAPRINARRFGDAVATGAATVATACPFCNVMLADASASETNGPGVPVQDIAQLLLASLPPEPAAPTPTAPESAGTGIAPQSPLAIAALAEAPPSAASAIEPPAANRVTAPGPAPGAARPSASDTGLAIAAPALTLEPSPQPALKEAL
ncbi:MAG: (Fe-S)-binding protein [Bifidobacteriaceae bacterium]|jgi:Fe-S oxidoreductase|nr:(Fe-S)-binding protein [Bifidobacteriaceae bacterium]